MSKVCSVERCAAVPVRGGSVCAVHVVRPRLKPGLDGAPCETCDGSGECQSCDGTGEKECYACQHDGDCPECRGSASCRDCGGSGTTGGMKS